MCCLPLLCFCSLSITTNTVKVCSWHKIILQKTLRDNILLTKGIALENCMWRFVVTYKILCGIASKFAQSIFMSHCVLWREKNCGNFWVHRHFNRKILTVWFSNSFLGRVLPSSEASEEPCLSMYHNCSVTDNNCCPPFRCLNFGKLNDHGWYSLHSVSFWSQRCSFPGFPASFPELS
mgnify:FL=1